MKIRCWVFNKLVYPNNCDCGSVQFLGATYKSENGEFYKYLEINHDFCNHSSQIQSKGNPNVAKLFSKYEINPLKIGGIAIVPDDIYKKEINKCTI